MSVQLYGTQLDITTMQQLMEPWLWSDGIMINECRRQGAATSTLGNTITPTWVGASPIPDVVIPQTTDSGSEEREIPPHVSTYICGGWRWGWLELPVGPCIRSQQRGVWTDRIACASGTARAWRWWSERARRRQHGGRSRAASARWHHRSDSQSTRRGK